MRAAADAVDADVQTGAAQVVDPLRFPVRSHGPEHEGGSGREDRVGTGDGVEFVDPAREAVDGIVVGNDGLRGGVEDAGDIADGERGNHIAHVSLGRGVVVHGEELALRGGRIGRHAEQAHVGSVGQRMVARVRRVLDDVVAAQRRDVVGGETMLIGIAHVERSVRTDGHGVDDTEVAGTSRLLEEIIHLLVAGDPRLVHRDAHEVVRSRRDVVEGSREPCQSLRHRSRPIRLRAGGQAAHDGHVARGHIDRTQLEVGGIGGVCADGIEDAALIVRRNGRRRHAEAGVEDVLASGVEVEAEDVLRPRADGVVTGRHLEGHVLKRTAEVLEVACRRKLAGAGSGSGALVHRIELVRLGIAHPVERASGADDETGPDPCRIGHGDAVAGKGPEIEGAPCVRGGDEKRAGSIRRHVADAAEDHRVARDVGELVLSGDGAIGGSIDADQVIGVLLDIVQAAVVADEIVRLTLRGEVVPAAGKSPGKGVTRGAEVVTADAPAAAGAFHIVGTEVAGKKGDGRRREKAAGSADDIAPVTGVELIELPVVAPDRKVVAGRRRAHAEESGLAGREPVAVGSRRISTGGVHHHAEFRSHRAGVKLSTGNRRHALAVVARIFAIAGEVDHRARRQRLRTGERRHGHLSPACQRQVRRRQLDFLRLQRDAGVVGGFEDRCVDGNGCHADGGGATRIVVADVQRHGHIPQGSFEGAGRQPGRRSRGSRIAAVVCPVDLEAGAADPSLGNGRRIHEPDGPLRQHRRRWHLGHRPAEFPVGVGGAGEGHGDLQLEWRDLVALRHLRTVLEAVEVEGHCPRRDHLPGFNGDRAVVLAPRAAGHEVVDLRRIGRCSGRQREIHGAGIPSDRQIAPEHVENRWIQRNCRRITGPCTAA